MRPKTLSWDLCFFLLWCFVLLPTWSDLPAGIILSTGVMWAVAVALKIFSLKLPRPLCQGIRLAMLLMALALSWTYMQGRFRVEDAINFFVFLPILKNVELGHSRDRRMQILILILLWTAELLLCSQLLWIAVGLGLAMLMIYLLTMAYLSRVSFNLRSLKTASTFIVLALPLTLICFLFFPRIQFFSSIYWPQGKTGISTSLAPGDLASLALDDSVFANVIFDRPPSREMPSYWRYATLRNSEDGWHWKKSTARPLHSEIKTEVSVSYSVYYEAMGDGTLVNLEGTSRLEAKNRMLIHSHSDQTFSGIYFQGKRPMYRGEWTRQAIIDPPLPYDLAVPQHLGPQITQLAQTLKTSKDPINALGQFFANSFAYSLTPGTYRSAEDFLFGRRLGYCEHFSASAALLLRLLGTPSRIVVGFLSMPPQETGVLTLLNSDSHAWVEYWSTRENHWQRFDPTNYVAPARMQLSQSRWRLQGRAGASGWLAWLRQNVLVQGLGRLRSAYLKTNMWMVNFDRDEQRQVWKLEGQNSKILWAIGIALLLVMIMSGALAIYMRRQKLDPLTREWRRAISKWFPQEREAPFQSADLWQRLAHEQWVNANEFDTLAKYYLRLRYGPDRHPHAHRTLRKAITQFHPSKKSC
ncbi:MAG: hypothetical protein A2X86_20245 [Bdellovibrionales bacterium GWA2_49_15]|nr:MAG: hypothetical protein A2X86_20245 [Bdellovibrionales bacterium GWA2_49_15]